MICGNEIDVSEDKLVHGIDGTYVEILEKRKHRSDNKSGFRGVYRLKNGKFRVVIGFKGKKYTVGIFHTFEEAVQNVEKINGKFLGN